MSPFLHGSYEEYADINWDELRFGLVPTDYMYAMKCSRGEEFTRGELNRYGNIELSPSAGILNYGQVQNIPSTDHNIARSYTYLV